MLEATLTSKRAELEAALAALAASKVPLARYPYSFPCLFLRLPSSTPPCVLCDGIALLLCPLHPCLASPQTRVEEIDRSVAQHEKKASGLSVEVPSPDILNPPPHSL